MGLWTARQIWKTLDRDLREQVAMSFWADERLDRGERLYALAPWLTARGLRPGYLDKLPKTRRATLMAEGGLPEDTAIQLLMSFHLVNRRPLLACFLDVLNIKHEDGIISEDAEVEDSGPEAVSKAAEALKADHDAAEVDLYLKTLTATDPVTWEHVGALIGDPE